MKAAIYARYSSDNQREESIDAQIRAIQEYALRNNYEIVKIYVDEARSATTDDRPQFLQMIKDSELKQFNLLIVHKLDRFARNRYDSAFYKRELIRNGVRIISVLENLDDSPESIILESVLEGMAEYYSRNLAREVMKGMKETALQCKHTGGTPPLGFDVDTDKSYVINETEALIVKKIYDLYLDGYGYAKIAENLNNAGYKTKPGNKFSKNSIYEILINEKYIGTFVFNKRSGKNNGKRNNHVYKDDVIKIPNSLPQIIDELIFNKVQDKLHNKKRGPRISSNNFYLLTGKLICGECGGPYTGNSYWKSRNGDKHLIYSCSTRKRNKQCSGKSIRQDVIESYVEENLINNLFTDEKINQIADILLSSSRKLNDKSEEISILKGKLKEITLKQEKMLDAFLEGTLDKQVVKLRDEKFNIEKELIEERLKELSYRNYDWVNKDLIKQFLINNKNNLLSEDCIKKRKAIELFIDSIILSQDNIEINFNINLDRDRAGGGEGN